MNYMLVMNWSTAIVAVLAGFVSEPWLVSLTFFALAAAGLTNTMFFSSGDSR